MSQGPSKGQLIARAEEIREEALAGKKRFRCDGADKVTLEKAAGYAHISRAENETYVPGQLREKEHKVLRQGLGLPLDWGDEGEKGRWALGHD